jgi:hypothetical protein
VTHFHSSPLNVTEIDSSSALALESTETTSPTSLGSPRGPYMADPTSLKLGDKHTLSPAVWGLGSGGRVRERERAFTPVSLTAIRMRMPHTQAPSIGMGATRARARRRHRKRGHAVDSTRRRRRNPIPRCNESTSHRTGLSKRAINQEQTSGLCAR